MVKKQPSNAGDVRHANLLHGSERSGEGNGNWLQYSCLENSMGREALWATVYGAAESDTTKQMRAHTHTHTHAHAQITWS